MQKPYIVIILAATTAAQNKLVAFMPGHIKDITDTDCLDDVSQRIAKRANKDGTLCNVFVYKFTSEESMKKYETDHQLAIGGKFMVEFDAELASGDIKVFRNWDELEVVYKRA